MEPEKITFVKEELVISLSASILNINLFISQTILVALDVRGQIHIYQKRSQKWIHKSTTKLFECPIVAIDVNHKLGQHQLVLVGYNGTVKICTLTPGYEIIVRHELEFNLDSPIISCIWGLHANELILTTQTQQILLANTALNISKLFTLPKGPSDSGFSLLRKGYETIYISQGSQIAEIQYIINDNDKSLTHQVIINAKQAILDFLVSSDPIYNNLIILTEQHLYFYVVNLTGIVLISSMLMTQRPVCSKLGWGQNYIEVGVYQCVNGVIQSRSFIKQTTGFWSEQGVKLLSEEEQKYM